MKSCSISDLPTGTVTFLFTDIEGSTRLIQRLGDPWSAEVIAEHRRLLRGAFEEGGGHEIETQGDAFLVAFPRARDAVATAVAAQRAIAAYPWPEGSPLRVRMGLHTGEPPIAAGGYIGLDVHRTARICSAGHGAQILLSRTTRDLIQHYLPEGVSLRDLGEHRLKDLAHPEHVFQLVILGLPADFPPLKSLQTLRNNLPLQLTSFIGREREIAEVRRLLSTARLLTLTGSGGCGKTRLALQVAAELLEAFADGVWWVGLEALTDPALVAKPVGLALGLREEPGRPLLATLLVHLQPKQLALVLDNCEHLVEACAQLADPLLHTCPNLRILATSREALGIAGEATWRVPSLSLPKSGRMSVEGLMQSEAAQLFVERATAVLPTFTVTDRNGPLVAQVCQRLDGIPLAIELAAARMKVLSLEQITLRLDDRFQLLTGGSRTVLPRHRTLRATMDWSYDLLSEGEQLLLRRLSVFAGGWTLQAAEAVCAGEGVEGPQVLDLLTHLVTKSLVVVEQEEDERRYRLLEMVRQYSRERLLESEEDQVAHRRHLDWCLWLVERAEPELLSAKQMIWLDRLEMEHDNLRAALEWSLENAGEAGLRLGGALWRFWGLRSHLSEGRKRLADLLSLEGTGATTGRAKALTGAGVLAFFQGDYAAATALCEESLGLGREVGEKWSTVTSLTVLATCLQYDQGDYDRATALFEESLARAREMGDKWLIAISLYNLGEVAQYQGDYERGAALCEESLVLAREVGERWQIAVSLMNLGMLAAYQGDYGRATVLFEESLTLRRELGDRWGIAGCLEGLAGMSGAAGHPERMARLLGAADSLREAIGAGLWHPISADHDRNMAAARDALGEEAFAGAWGQGRAFTLEQAIEYALTGED